MSDSSSVGDRNHRSKAHIAPPPRFIRLRDAPAYLGMDKNRFNREVRPNVLALRIGVQGIAFDRVDLDAWADDYKSRNGCHAARSRRSKSVRERKTAPSCCRGRRRWRAR